MKRSPLYILDFLCVCAVQRILPLSLFFKTDTQNSERRREAGRQGHGREREGEQRGKIGERLP